MLMFFQICFGVGLAMTLLNTILGALFGIADFGLDFDLDFDFDFRVLMPVSPSLMFLFFTVFGGTGMMLYDKFFIPVVLLIALGISVAVNFVIFTTIIKPLKKLSSKETAGHSECIGAAGRIGDAVEENGFGSILITIDGNKVSYPVKSADGKPIYSGELAVVIEIKEDYYIVEKLEGGALEE